MISVVICTRNRALKLEDCLRQMTKISTNPDCLWQLVVVDNGSEDHTRAVVEQFLQSLPLKYVYEARRGLSHARNRGIVESRYPIIAFTDDDCLVAREWVRAIVNEFARHPEVSILGGRVEAADPSGCPVAIRMHYLTEQISTIAQIATVMSGCNMAMRRAVFDTVGVFDPALGKGARTGSAEDVDFLYRALKAGVKIAYSPDVVVRHAHGRNTAASLEALAHDYVKGRGAFYCKFAGDRQIAKMAYWEVQRLLRDCVRLRAASESAKTLLSLAAGAVYLLLGRVANGAARAVSRFH